MSQVTELLGCEHPVIQGAMGVISNPEMVAAVSEAGGFGLLNVGRFQVRALRTPLVEEVLTTGEIASGAFGNGGFEASWIEGDLSAGEVIGLIDEVLSVREIIEEMVGGR